MITLCSNRFQTIPFVPLIKYALKPQNLRNSSPYLICCNFCHSYSPGLSDDAITYFKNRNLGQFVNKVIDGNISLSIPHFNYSPIKKANLLSLIEQFNTSITNLTSLKDLQKDADDDPDFSKSVQEEILSHEKSLGEVEEAILNELLSKEDQSVSDITVEVTAGVGGQEAMLFAKEVHDLYCNYFNFCGWQYELANLEETELGGVRHSMLLVSGRRSYKILSIEGGVHRVQRIPATEKYGRLQTSTITVTVYPQPSEVDIVIPDSDLRIETKTSTGPGGQHANRIQTAVRFHHLPTGIIVECQTTRSQTQNRTLAMQRLRSKLFKLECEKRDSKIDSVRRFQMGLKGRNEKIRTYNYAQDRITDHRYHISLNNVEKYFQGGSYYHNFLEQLHVAQSQKQKEEFLQAIKAIK